METESWYDTMLAPISLGAEDAQLPKAQLYKDISELRITPDEGTTGLNARTQFTFTNRNLDIIQMLHDSYISYKLKIETGTTPTTFELLGTESAKLEEMIAKVIPQTAFWIDGFTFEINDTTIDTQNSDLAKTLNVVNGGVFAEESSAVDYIGLAVNPANATSKKSPFAVQKNKVGTSNFEFKIPLKYIIPYFKDNKISWGTKTTIKLTKVQNMVDMFEGATGFTIELVDNGLELVIPYCKLENNKQLALWNSMYSSTTNRYWLGSDYFNSSPYANDVAEENLTYRIATKGLNSRPRWLLLSAVDSDSSATATKRLTPLGFHPITHAKSSVAANKDADPIVVGSATVTGVDGSAENSLRVKKLRCKINGLYTDGGDVMEFKNIDAAAGYANVPQRHYSGDYMLAYEQYLKFFGAYYSKRASPVSFDEWLHAPVFCFDLVNIDSEQIFQNSGNALIVEIEFSHYAGSTATKNFKWIANLLYDKQLSISHSDNKAILNLS